MSKSKTFRSKSSDHVPVVPTMVSTNPVGTKRIRVFRNGDQFYPGIALVVNTHRTPNIDVVLDTISQKIGLSHGAKKLYTMHGVLVKDVNKIRDGENYVASSGHFTSLAYGGEVIKEVVKKKKKRSKTTHSKERKPKMETHHLDVEIPLNHEKVAEKPKKMVKKKKKKMVKNTSSDTLQRRLDGDIIDIPLNRRESAESGTAEIELPSEIEDSEEEVVHRGRHSRKGSEAATSHHFQHNSHHRSVSRQSNRYVQKMESEDEEEKEMKRKEKEEEEEKKKKKGKKKSETNWGDLSSFTKNIESLLKR